MTKGKVDGYRLLCSCAKGGAEYKITEITEHTIRNLQPHTAYNITLFSYLKEKLSRFVNYDYLVTQFLFLNYDIVLLKLHLSFICGKMLHIRLER